MEASRFCSFRFSAAVIVGLALTGSFFLRADPSEEIRSVVVDVEAPIKNGDLADAKTLAESKAFEAALDQSLPTTMEAKERAQRVKNASQWVKTFRVDQQQEAGGVLKVRYRVDVIISLPASDHNPSDGAVNPVSTAPGSNPSASLPTPGAAIPNLAPSTSFGEPTLASPSTALGSSPLSSAPANESRSFFYELTWRPSEVDVNPLEVVRMLRAQGNLRIESVRINRGSMIFEAFVPSAEIGQAQIQRFVDNKIQVRGVVDPNSALVQPERSAAPAPFVAGPQPLDQPPKPEFSMPSVPGQP